MKVRNKLLLVVLAALLAVSVVATGCKAKPGNGGEEITATETTVVRIGVGAPLTQGAVAIGQGLKRGAQLAVEDENASSQAEKLGIKFELVDGDDQGDPQTGTNVANMFASDTSLVGVMGHFNSGVSIPASKVYNENNILMISPGSTNPELTKQGLKNVFRVCATDDVQGPAGAESAFNKFGYKKAVVVDDSTPYGEGLAAEFAKKFEELGGQILFKEKTSDKDTDFNALVTKITSQKPDMIFYGGMYNAGALLAKQATDAGFTGPTMGGDGISYTDWITLQGGKTAEGDLSTSVGLPVSELPKAAEFQSKYAEKFPSEEIGNFDAYGYDATYVIINAVYKVAEDLGVKELTSPAGRDALIEAVKATDLSGVTGKLGFDEKGDTSNQAITTYQVENGEWVPKVIPGKD
ncbi:MAG: branched-chain amino acid ABC transporter substrate-binding protein [Coriobacteriia bacterium]|nr:branched-chain amino acid ABC transporter substrate-binding protein [Coriobacteriia bacterium]